MRENERNQRHPGGSSDAVFRPLVEYVPDFVCLATTHGELFYLNSAARRWIGLDEDASLVAVTLHDFHTEESWQELRDVAVPGVNKTGQWEGRRRLNPKTGQESAVFTFMYRVKWPQGDRSSCLAFVHRDAEALNRLRECLSEAQSRKNSILESSLDPIITIYHEGVIIEFNRAAEQTFGHSREKVLCTRPSDVPEDPSRGSGRRFAPPGSVELNNTPFVVDGDDRIERHSRMEFFRDWAWRDFLQAVEGLGVAMYEGQAARPVSLRPFHAIHEGEHSRLLPCLQVPQAVAAFPLAGLVHARHGHVAKLLQIPRYGSRAR